MRDAGEVEDGIEILQRVETSVIAEWALSAEFIKVDVTFEYDFARGRDLEGDSFALDEIDWGSAQESGDEIFLNVWGCGDGGGKGVVWIGADGDGDLHSASGPVSRVKNRPSRDGG